MTDATVANTEGGLAERKLFSPAVVLGLVLIGIVSFSALVVFQTYAPDKDGEKDPGAHALSPAAVGYSGMVRLLNGMGRSAVIVRGPVALTRPSVMILTLDDGDPETDLSQLPTTQGYRGPRLAVLPKWDTAYDRRKTAWVKKRDIRKTPAQTWIGPGDKSETIVLAQGKGVGPRRLIWTETGREMVTGPIDRMQVFTVMKPNWTPLIVDEAGNVVMARHGNSAFYALSEPDLLNNQGMASIANARAGIAVIDTLKVGSNPTALFDVSLNGFARTRSLFKLAFEPPFVAATLCGFFAILLAGWGAWHRFGAARRQGREFALGKRALADNQAGLIRMANREPRMARPYVHLVRDQVARAIGAPRDLPPEALNAFLDRVAAHRGAADSFGALNAAADDVRDTHDLSRLAGRLHIWRLEMTRES